MSNFYQQYDNPYGSPFAMDGQPPLSFSPQQVRPAVNEPLSSPIPAPAFSPVVSPSDASLADGLTSLSLTDSPSNETITDPSPSSSISLSAPFDLRATHPAIQLESVPLSPQVQHPTITTPSAAPTSAPNDTSAGSGSADHGQSAGPQGSRENNVVAKSQPVLLSSSKIPNRKAIANKTHLPFGVIYSPTLAMLTPPPMLQRPPLRCSNCGAYINRFCKLDTPYDAWFCSLCDNKNPARGSFTQNGSYPELVKHVYEFVQEVDNPNVSSGGSSAFIFVIDANITQSDAQGIRESILASLASLPPNATVAVLSFSRVVKVFSLIRSQPIAATAISGFTALERADAAMLQHNRDSFLVGLDHARRHISNVLHCISAAAAPDANRRKSKKKGKNAPEPRRATGAALAVALALTAQADTVDFRPSQILLFTDGSPSYGPGALSFADADVDSEGSHRIEHAHEYFKLLGLEAARRNVAVTFLCGGAANFHTPTLHTVSLPSGGSLLLLRDFTSSSLHANLQLAVSRCVGRNGVFDVRTSESIQLTRIIGPSSPSPKFDPAGEIPSEGTNTCYMASVVPGQSFSIFYEPAEDVVGDYVYLQFVSRYTTNDDVRVVRVVTRRVGTTNNMATFLSSVDLDVLFVLIAKRAVLSARKGLDSEDVDKELDKQLKQILQAFGERNRASLRYELVTPLQPLPRKLFSLRRGPLLGPILQHKDDIDHVRCLFLNADFEDSLRLIDPRLYEIQTGSYVEVAMSTLALQSSNILYLDQHTHIFIWSGMDAIGPALDNIRNFALQEAHAVSASRFPQPQIMLFAEGSSMSRFLLCRLGPDHKDELNEQISLYAPIARLSPVDRAQFNAKFHYTDDPSFNQYFWLLTSTM